MCEVMPFQIFSHLEYPSYFYTQGCGNADCLKIVCQVGHLERGKSAILYLKSRLWTQTFMNVSDCEYSVSETLKVIFLPTCNTNFVFSYRKKIKIIPTLSNHLLLSVS